MRRLSLAQAFVADLHVAQSLATWKKIELANTSPTKGSSTGSWSLSKTHPFRKTMSSEATLVINWLRHCNTLKPTKARCEHLVHVHFLLLSIPTRFSSFFSYCSSMRLKARPSAKKWPSNLCISLQYHILMYSPHKENSRDIPRSPRSHGGVSIQHVEISIIAYPTMQQLQNYAKLKRIQRRYYNY